MEKHWQSYTVQFRKKRECEEPYAMKVARTVLAGRGH